MKTLATFLLLLALGAAAVPAQTTPAPSTTPRAAWDRETLRLAATLPVQEGGRVKPLDTWAGFLLLACNGRRSVRDLEGRKLGQTEWVLDCLFHPERAENYKCFLVQTDEVLDAVALPHEGKKKRDRYSLAELRPVRDKLFELGDSYGRLDAKQRSYVQEQTLRLAHHVHAVELLQHGLDFARFDIPVPPSLAEVFKGHDHASLSVVMLHAPSLVQHYSQQVAAAGSEQEAELEELSVLLNRAQSLVSNSTALTFFPPVGSRTDAPQWLTPADVLAASFAADSHAEKQVKLILELEGMVRERDNPANFHAGLERFHAGVAALAGARSEYDKVGLEVFFYRGKFLHYSLMFFLFGFVLVAVGWLRTAGRILAGATWTMLIGGAAALVTAIVLRCMIRGRPPVSTLYETILFITAIAVISSLLIERMNRQRIALALAAVLGTGGLFLAFRYEAMEAIDTMPSLVAVLDTNFWLSTHVTTVTMGYSAGLLASAFAHLWVLGKLFGLKRGEPRFYSSLSRMTYGVICFGLLFATVGTILGGIWANESWGRFWGWDPKENGALMIVLWELFILHARMGGYIRDTGLAMAAIFGGMIVSFSWWGVNLLGIGLHSYGFTSGIMRSLLVFYILEVLMLGACVVLWMRSRKDTGARPRPSPAIAGGTP